MTSLTIFVIGVPVPQGSKVANSFGNGVRDTNAKKLKPWRADVSGCALDAAEKAGWDTLDHPCQVDITFYMPRNPSHYGTGRNAGIRKTRAPFWCHVKPDLDKLTRAILDSLTDAAVIRDDSRVVRMNVEKRYADAATGARITVTPINPSPAVPATTPAAGEDHTPESEPN